MLWRKGGKIEKARRARETPAPEEREARLPQMGTHGRRCTCEAHEKREANLQQTSDDWRD